MGEGRRVVRRRRQGWVKEGEGCKESRKAKKAGMDDGRRMQGESQAKKARMDEGGRRVQGELLGVRGDKMRCGKD